MVDVSSTNGHVIEEDASHWTPGQVRDWFRDNGYKEFEVCSNVCASKYIIFHEEPKEFAAHKKDILDVLQAITI